MTIRCTSCSACADFRNKRGAKLSERSCPCGGKYETLASVWTGEAYVYSPRKSDRHYTLNVDTMKFEEFIPLKRTATVTVVNQ